MNRRVGGVSLLLGAALATLAVSAPLSAQSDPEPDESESGFLWEGPLVKEGSVEGDTELRPVPGTPGTLEGSAGQDLRSLERLFYSCRNDVARRDVTLFGNGTVRLREGLLEEQTLLLDELEPEDLRSYLGRLARIRTGDGLPNPDQLGGGVTGDWVERCEVRLRLADTEPLDLAFGRLDSLPLAVAHLIEIADELAASTRPLDPPRRLPRGYRPRPGDVLSKEAGARYRVVNLTADGEGVEMEAFDEPVRIFYRIDELRQVFVELEYRDPLVLQASD